MKKLFASFTFAAASLLAAAPSAYAATYSVANTALYSEEGYSFQRDYSAGSFSDSFTFTLTDPLSSFSSIASKLSARVTQQVTSFTGLLTGTGGLNQSLDYSSGPGYQLLSYEGALAAGTYSLTLSGTSTVRGSYGVSLIASPVPEPESYAMMLAGLAVMGAIARKRSQNEA